MSKFVLFFLIQLIGFAQNTNLPTYENALEEYKKKEFQKSIEMIRELILQNGTKYEYHYLAAHDYWNLGNFKSAYNHFQASIKFKPEDVKAYIDLVKLHENSKNYKTALSFCESSIELFPKEYELKILQAGLLLKFSRFEYVQTILEKLKLENPNDYRPLLVEANIYFAIKDLEKAELTLKWASSISENNPYILNNLAILHEQFYLKKSTDAKQKLNLAIEEINQAAKKSTEPAILENQKRILAYPK